MIPIRYSSTKMPNDYEAFYKAFKDKIELWYNKQQISSKNQFDAETLKFLKYILEKKRLKNLLNMPAEVIPDKIKSFKKHFKGFTNQISGLLELCRVIFIRHGYSSTMDSDKYSFPKNELIDDVNADVCPYCNRNFIKHVTSSKTVDNGNPITVEVKAQLDHFYDKDKYPYLAVTRHNLVPCCPTCNGRGGKYTDDAGDKGIVNPFAMKDSEGLKFTIDVGKSGLLDLGQLEHDLKIGLACKPGSNMDKNKETFNLQALYDTHKDFAAEMYKIHLFTNTQAYRDFISKILGDPDLGVSKEDIFRLFFGTYENPSQFNKRPLSKFKNDILDDIGRTRE